MCSVIHNLKDYFWLSIVSIFLRLFTPFFGDWYLAWLSVVLHNTFLQLDADGELILLYGLLDPVAAAGLVQGLDELRLRRLVVDRHLFHLGVAFLV